MDTLKQSLLEALSGMALQYQVRISLPADASEKVLLKALADLADEFLFDGLVLDNLCMSAGEHTMVLLEEGGLLDLDDCRRGRWTDAGRAVLNSD